MSLDFYFENKVHEPEKNVYSLDKDGNRVWMDHVWPVCSVLMAIGISYIKEDNIDEIMRRYAFMKGLFYPSQGTLMVARESFTRMIGLTTNVSRESDVKFVKKMWLNFSKLDAKSHESISDKHREEIRSEIKEKMLTIKVTKVERDLLHMSIDTYISEYDGTSAAKINIPLLETLREKL